MAMTTPQCLGKENNPLITVGGVDQQGKLWTRTSLDRGRGGCISVYAMAVGAEVADFREKISLKFVSGTSVAAPAVAGLAGMYLDPAKGKPFSIPW